MGHDFEPLSAQVIEAAMCRLWQRSESSWDEMQFYHESTKVRKHEIDV
jgi:hypothetical protein